MAEIILNVDVRQGTGTGGARAVRRAGAVPGILYGGEQAPVAISVNEKDFKKSLYTGKLLGHLVTLKYGEETQPVIAKDIQFDPVSDRPVHFDLMRVDAKGEIKISVPVHFKNADEAPFSRQGGSLEVVRHEVEIAVRADKIPEELVVDLTASQIGDTIRMSDIKLPKGASATITDRDFVIATIKVSSAAQSEAADEAAAAAEAEG
ncbi:large subunit ribosomal protein L25 [Brevundimonas nasdae]|jgi:large subunit ribosomal protein L25|uniref:Large ribosomal subunit protein bL25 n=1 Tax=Brevundimonas nasdae TaxID=172043 RepID=A0ABX8TNH8_9CAUL|nr:50S ribosomal protein L25/general stress protein Ctc [Brevundimonas nasdae]MBK6024003.1 50S ribosomal protein L25/general stress protein Ctc [Brevundimonas nasdae]MDQ0450658.1 large subunit ribosomal protein L25 [Brevundimonas nasdae]QYC10844.1 50S ribosomal protein L25/general stress protein Ctc [Brevundimonas nasdae]QYC13631.1 50S ribosomal protein L25/general stress protein Ctc [Brevundimonas nasdae]